MYTAQTNAEYTNPTTKMWFWWSVRLPTSESRKNLSTLGTKSEHVLQGRWINDSVAGIPNPYGPSPSSTLLVEHPDSRALLAAVHILISTRNLVDPCVPFSRATEPDTANQATVVPSQLPGEEVPLSASNVETGLSFDTQGFPPATCSCLDRLPSSKTITHRPWTSPGNATTRHHRMCYQVKIGLQNTFLRPSLVLVLDDICQVVASHNASICCGLIRRKNWLYLSCYYFLALDISTITICSFVSLLCRTIYINAQ